MNKKKVILLVSIFLVVVVLAVASSYALFTLNVTKNTNFKLAIGTLELSITDTTTEDKYILENIEPTKDEVALSNDGYTFTIKNTGTIDSYYTVYLDDILLTDAGERLDNSYIRLNLLNKNTNKSNTKKLTDYPETDRALIKGYLKKGESVTYVLRMWVDYKTGNEAQNKYFATQIRVVGTQANAVAYQELLLNGADPVLSDNLTPVEIQDNGVVTKADIYNEWYSYENKRWANAVVLKTPEEVIGEDNIHGATINDDHASFDGKDDYIDLGLAGYDFGNSMSVAVTFKINELLSQNAIMGNWQTNGIAVYASNKDIIVGIYGEEINKYVTITTTLNNINKYYTLVLTYDGSELKLYLDGVLVDSENITDNIKVSTFPFYLGANPGVSVADYYGNINIKDYAIYNRTLTEEEISTNMKKDIKVTDSTGLLRYGDFSNKFTAGEVIPESNIESYFVWIPKYSYQIWDLGNYSSLTTIDTTRPHTIPIKFGTTNTSDSVEGECTTPGVAGESGSCKVGDYMTHPAFIAFNSNGLWVGKFETGNSAATSTDDTILQTVNLDNLVIKPNVYSWRNIKLGNMFKVSYNYLRDDESHMMKNTEWGAVAYLQHSAYGSETSVRINNNSAYITGYAGTEEPTVGYKGESIEGNRVENTSLGNDGTYTVNYLNSLSNVASTTGNKTGIYDMSGGSWEYVAGYTTGANTTGGSSGITTLYTDFYTNSSWNKYYDKYSSTTNTDFNNRILGDATGEIGPFGSQTDPDKNTRYKSSWYGNFVNFANSNSAWFARGSIWNSGSSAGVSSFGHNTGGAHESYSFRVILSPTK